MRRLRNAVLIVAAALIALGGVVTAWVEVPPGESVVIRRLGRVLPAAWGPGLHLGWPFGLEQRERVRTDLVRRLEIGLSGPAGANDEPGAGEYLTGDRNLVRVRAVVQYRVADPVDYLLRTDDVTVLLNRLSESALARALARAGLTTCSARAGVRSLRTSPTCSPGGSRGTGWVSRSWA